MPADMKKKNPNQALQPDSGFCGFRARPFFKGGFSHSAQNPQIKGGKKMIGYF